MSVAAGCAKPRAANPPPPCPPQSEAAEAQVRTLPKGSPLVYWLDQLGEVCDDLDALRGEL